VSGIDRPTDDEIIAAVAAALDAPEAVALVWLVSMFRSFDPKAAAERLAARGGA
jgi:hypothetical protein